MPWVGQLVGKSAVVGQEKQAVGVHIKSAHGVEADSFSVLPLNVAAEVGDVSSTLFVACCANDSAGLIEHNAYLFVANRLDDLALPGNLIGFRGYFLAKLGYVAVDRYSAELYTYFLLGYK